MAPPIEHVRFPRVGHTIHRQLEGAEGLGRGQSRDKQAEMQTYTGGWNLRIWIEGSFVQQLARPTHSVSKSGCVDRLSTWRD